MKFADNPHPAYRPFLDKVRWGSAALVAIGHALGILNNHTDGLPIINLVADMRGSAVTIFFILSGYLVGGSVVRDFDRFDFHRYGIARFSRIYIVLIPALVLTLALDGSVWLFDPHNPVYAEIWQGGTLGSTSIWGRFSTIRLLGTILSIEPISGVPVGSAGTLWSLGFEWIFYFTFPLIYGIGYRLRGQLGAGVAIALSVALTFALSKIDAAFWLVWLLGAYANLAERSGVFRGRPWTPWLKLTAGVALLLYVALGDRLNHQIGLPIAGIFGLIFLASGDLGEQPLVSHLDPKLAHFSYSLYVTHLQIMTLLTALLVRFKVLPLGGFRNPLEVLGISSLFVMICAVVAYGFGKLFESRTADLSKMLRIRFHKSTST